MTEGATRPGPTVTGFAINCAIAALRRNNIDPQQLLNHAGLAEHRFDDPQARVSALGQARFLEYSAEALDDSTLGLHLAEEGNPRDAGLLFYVGAAARNLGEALALVARYFRVADESVRMKLARQAEGFKVEITFVGLSRHLLRQQTEFGIAMLVKAMRAASGYDVRPTGVKFAHIRTGDVQEFRRFFGCVSSLARRRINWSSRTKHSPFRSSRETRSCWICCVGSARRLRERARPLQARTAPRSRTRFSGCCPKVGLTRKPSPRRSPSAPERCRAGYRKKELPSPRSLTNCGAASRSNISKTRALRRRRSRGCWAMRARPRSITPSGDGRAARRRRPEKRRNVPSQCKSRCARLNTTRAHERAQFDGKPHDPIELVGRGRRNRLAGAADCAGALITEERRQPDSRESLCGVDALG